MCQSTSRLLENYCHLLSLCSFDLHLHGVVSFMSIRKLAAAAVATGDPLREALLPLFVNDKAPRKQSLKTREAQPNQVDIVSESLCGTHGPKTSALLCSNYSQTM
jgi:hypothetical protein